MELENKIYWQGCGGQIDPSQLENYEATGNYVIESKRDGIWMVVISQGSEQIYLSRNGLQKSMTLPKLPDNTILCGEGGMGSQTAVNRRELLGHDFVDIHDGIILAGWDISNLDDLLRREAIENFLLSLPEDIRKHFILVPRWESSFRDHYEKESEGLILKQIKNRPHSPYVIGTRNPYWIKVKKVLTVDMVLMSYIVSTAETLKDKNMVGHVTCGVYKEGVLTPIVDVGSFPHELKIDMAHNWDKYVGKVVELKCFQVFKSGSLRHPSLVKVRDDKDAKDCTWSELVKLM